MSGDIERGHEGVGASVVASEDAAPVVEFAEHVLGLARDTAARRPTQFNLRFGSPKPSAPTAPVLARRIIQAVPTDAKDHPA